MALNLGGLFFTLDADTRGLMNAQRRVERFADQVRQAFRGVGRGTVDPQFAQQLARQERAVVSAMERIKRAQESVRRGVQTGTINARGAREAQVTLERLGNAYENFVRKMARPVALNTLDFGRRVQHMNSQIVDATRNIQRLQVESRQGTDVLHGFGSAALLVQGHLGGMSTRFFALTTLVRDFGVAAAVGIGVLSALAAGMALVGTQSIKAGMGLEAINKMFVAVSGNALVAQHHIDFVKEIANQAGIEFDSTAKSFARFLVSAQSAGLPLQTAQDAFKGIALSAATLQLSVEDTQGVFRALDQMMSKGTVQAEELRGQLGDRLPGAFVVAATAMGVTTRELNKMLKAGDVVAAEFVPKFAAAYQRMLGIDPSAPIKTLRAELTRAGNEWQYFLQRMNQVTNGTGILAAIVKQLGDMMRWATVNMEQLAGIVGGLTGAFLGLGLAMAAPAIIGFASTVVIWTQIILSSARAVGVLATASQLLNITLGANPLLRIITLLGTLAAMIGGAVLGYNLLADAVGKSNSVMSHTLSFTQDYIAQVLAQGAAHRQVTKDILQRAAAEAALAQATASASLRRFNESAGGPSVADRLISATTGLINQGPNAQQLWQRRRADLLKKGQSEAEIARQWRMAVIDLQKAVNLPAIGGGPGAFGDDTDKAGKAAKESVEGITNRIKDLIDAANIARQQLQAMMEPLTAGEDIQARMNSLQDLGEAMRIVNNLSPKELGTAAQLLGVPSDIEAVTNAVADLVGETRVAQEVVQDFIGVMEGIQTGERQMASLNRQMEFLRTNGIGDRQGLRYLEELGKAEEELRRLASSGIEGQKALQALVTYLQQLGVAGSNAAEMLANFNLQLKNQADQVRALEEFLERIRDVKNEVQDLMDVTSAMQSIGGIDKIFGGDISDAFEQAIKRGREVAAMVEALRAVKTPQDEINQRTERYLNLLRELDAAKIVYDNVRQQVERTQSAFRDMATESLQAVRGILTGVDSLSEGLIKLSQRIMDIAFESFVMAPFEDWMSSLGQKRGEAAAVGVDSQVASITSNAIAALGNAANGTSQTIQGQLIQAILGQAGAQLTQQVGTQAVTTVMAQLAVAASAAALALQALAVGAGGGGEEGSGGSGIIGSLVKLGTALFGPGGTPTPRATGGPVRAGQLYRINEPGIQDYFIPSVNGYMTNSAPGGSGNVVHIDARTSIDARGATQDVIQSLRSEMSARDARIRREMPYLIDHRTRENRQRLR